jgi:D-3-phosphoglycerate dehydrogenase / 2-oxoglutarate reductase
MSKIIISDHLFPSIASQKQIAVSAGFELSEAEPHCTTEDDIIQRCGEADALLVQWAPITRRVLSSLPRLKGVVRYGIGVNNIDLDAAKDLRIGVANVPTYCLDEVSTHAMAMILSLARRIPQDHHQIAAGGWGVAPLLPIPAISDLTLGLIGFGAISRRVAQKARAFGFRIIAADPYISDSHFSENGVDRVDLDSLFASADVISVHCPLVKETTHLINKDTLAKMKQGVLLVNTSRGPIVKEADLIGALQNGKLCGAGLDVFEEEPLPKDSPLRSLPNVVLTSHAASVSTRAVELLQIKAAEAACAFVEGKRPEGALVWPSAS